jgi:hypothetical protein
MTGEYMAGENNMLFDAWMKIGQDPIRGTEHK